MMATVVVACVLLAVCASVFGQVSAEKEASPLDMAAIKAEADKLRSEQFAIGESY